MKSFLKILDQSALTVFVLVLSDLIGMGIAAFSAYTLRNDFWGSEIQPWMEYAKAMPVVALILLVTFYSFGLYERSRRITGFGELYNLVRAITLVWVFVMAGSFLYKYDYSRILVVIFYGFGLFFINLDRFIVRHLARLFHKHGIGIVNVIIVGAGKPGKQIAEKLKKYESFGYRILGYIDNVTKPPQDGPPLLGSLEQLPQILQTALVHEIYVADPQLSHERILELIHQCDRFPVKFKVVSDLFEIVAGDIDLNELEGLPSLDLKKGGSKWLYRFFKRILDIIGAVAALVVSLPFNLILMVFIWIETGDSPLFKQKRVGQSGEIFTMYKFRTMRATTNPNAHAPKDSRDKRVTHIGRFLRRTSLDEIPQFWNVFKGEMSIVGPRPEMPFIVETYKDWQRHRLEVKPGITGLWQILGRKDLPLHENIEYDFYYIKNQSFFIDVVILLKTVATVITGRGAY
ncbi:MAG: sugar transferase [Candidatus Gracilibacteria bacterium]